MALSTDSVTRSPMRFKASVRTFLFNYFGVPEWKNFRPPQRCCFPPLDNLNNLCYDLLAPSLIISLIGLVPKPL
jgi:hypothetical protein